jgi:hypothetical protein
MVENAEPEILLEGYGHRLHVWDGGGGAIFRSGLK